MPWQFPLFARSQGLSLLELLFGLLLVSILLGLGLPSFTRLLAEQRTVAASADLHASIFHARSLAIHRNQRVTLCTTNDGVQCQSDIGWHAGWLMFEDVNGNAMVDAGEVVVSVTQAVASGLRLVGNAPVRNYVSYTATGAARMQSGALQIGTISICSQGQGREIVINSAGRPRIAPAPSC